MEALRSLVSALLAWISEHLKSMGINIPGLDDIIGQIPSLH